MQVESFGDRICKPANQVAEQPDPGDSNRQSKRIIGFFSFSWIRNREPLRMSNGHKEKVLKTSLPSSWPCNRNALGFSVNGLIYNIIDIALSESGRTA